MKQKSTIYVLVLCITALLVTGCQTKENITIKAGIERYSPLMSSTPGMPLTPEGKNGKLPENAVHHWTTEQGRFMTWNSTVTELGKEVCNDGGKIYWSVDFEEKSEASSFYIRLKVVDGKSGKTLSEAKLRIEKDKENESFYLVKE